jgi:hypothetical protein
VKLKNENLFFIDVDYNSMHFNINPELIWTQNTVCRRKNNNFTEKFVFGVLEGDFCTNKDDFYVLDLSVVAIDLNRNRTLFTFVDQINIFFIKYPIIRKIISNITKGNKIPLFSWGT